MNIPVVPTNYHWTIIISVWLPWEPFRDEAVMLIIVVFPNSYQALVFCYSLCVHKEKPSVLPARNSPQNWISVSLVSVTLYTDVVLPHLGLALFPIFFN